MSIDLAIHHIRIRRGCEPNDGLARFRIGRIPRCIERVIDGRTDPGRFVSAECVPIHSPDRTITQLDLDGLGDPLSDLRSPLSRRVQVFQIRLSTQRFVIQTNLGIHRFSLVPINMQSTQIHRKRFPLDADALDRGFFESRACKVINRRAPRMVEFMEVPHRQQRGKFNRRIHRRLDLVTQHTRVDPIANREGLSDRDRALLSRDVVGPRTVSIRPLEPYESRHRRWRGSIVREPETGQPDRKLRCAAVFLTDPDTLVHRGNQFCALDRWGLARDEQAVVSPARGRVDGSHREGPVAHRLYPLGIRIESGSRPGIARLPRKRCQRSARFRLIWFCHTLHTKSVDKRPPPCDTLSWSTLKNNHSAQTQRPIPRSSWKGSPSMMSCSSPKHPA